MKSVFIRSLAATALAAFTTATMAQAQSRYDELANLPFSEGYVAKDNVRTLLGRIVLPARACSPTSGRCPRSTCTA